MPRPLKPHHYDRIVHLFERDKFPKLVDFIVTLKSRDFDVAAQPFRILDKALSQDRDVHIPSLMDLNQVTVGAQPTLFQCILQDFEAATTEALDTLVQDRSAHAMTRFEAMGWSVFLRHRHPLPTRPLPTHAPSIFQFWDAPTPPEQVQIGNAMWELMPLPYTRYDANAATSYIQEHFGTSAAHDFNALWHPALQSDVFRLFRLQQEGGIYADADSQPGMGVPDFISSCGTVPWAISATKVPNCVVTNGFIAAPANDPMISGFLEHVLRMMKDHPKMGIFWLSGPGALTAYLYNTSHTMHLLPAGTGKDQLFAQFDAPYKETEQNWRVFEHAQGLTNEAGLAAALTTVP